MAASVLEVARYLLRRTGPVSRWKLQKLCYYAQAWQIAWTERELFPEDFEAWSNGPVCRKLYGEYQEQWMVEPEDNANEISLTEDERETIDLVLEHYGNLGAYDLELQVCSEPPWREARKRMYLGEEPSAVISKERMGEYYGSL